MCFSWLNINEHKYFSYVSFFYKLPAPVTKITICLVQHKNGIILIHRVIGVTISLSPYWEAVIYLSSYMKKSETESKKDLYNVYYTNEGKKIIVLEGLNPVDEYHPPLSQQFLHDNYSVIALFYWLLLCSTLIYLLGLYIIIPLLQRFNLYR